MEAKSEEVERAFPHLAKEGYAVTSPRNHHYNCVAWAAGEDDCWWDTGPGYSWPEGAPRDATIEALIAAYSRLGFEICQGSALEIGFEKVAVYGDEGSWTHASRQLESGRWTSKLGRHEDIEHANPEAVADSQYGSVICIMRRPKG